MTDFGTHFEIKSLQLSASGLERRTSSADNFNPRFQVQNCIGFGKSTPAALPGVSRGFGFISYDTFEALLLGARGLLLLKRRKSAAPDPEFHYATGSGSNFVCEGYRVVFAVLMLLFSLTDLNLRPRTANSGSAIPQIPDSSHGSFGVPSFLWAWLSHLLFDQQTTLACLMIVEAVGACNGVVVS